MNGACLPQVLLEGHATPEGTADYARLHPAAKGHYRTALGWTVSSLGLGTYLGATDAAARAAYVEAASAALAGGVNVVDTAPNYRDQASERDLGKALAAYVAGGGRREHVVVATKAGFLHGDCEEADPEAWFGREYLGEGGAPPVLHAGDVRSGHSLAPAFVAHQMERSRRNLGLATLDVLFLHNPEHQLEWGVPEDAFYAAVEDAFETLERACDAGRLGVYGVATWDGLRVGPETKGHLSLVKLVHHAGQARMRADRAAGKAPKAGGHHFRALQLPVNLGMSEAALKPTQPYRFGAQTALECARDLGMLVLSSASLAQMRMAGRLPPEYAAAFGTSGDAHTALQFARSVPGVTTALVGMGRPEHARANAAFAASTPPDPATVKTLLGTGSVHGW